jgi:hypothetical protein
LLLTNRLLFIDLLRSRQIAQVEPSLKKSSVLILGLNQQLEDGMRAGALGVHGGLPNGPILDSLFKQLHTVLEFSHTELCQPLHENPLHLRLVDPQRLRLLAVLSLARATCSKSNIFSLYI